MRVLLINQVFAPDVAATAQHAHDLAQHLVKAGHQVDVIASRSIYWPTGTQQGLLPKRETIDGIEVHRVGRSIFGKRSYLARAADFALFYVAAFLKCLFVRRPDVAVCFTTPPMIALLGVVLQVFRRSRFVYWVMDLYPDLPVFTGLMRRGGMMARSFESLHRFILRRADRVVVLGRCMRARVLAKGIPESKVEIIHVWSDAEEIRQVPPHQNEFRRAWALGDAFVVMYAGNFGIGHDMGTMLDAALRLRDRNDIRFVFAGGGARKKTVDAFLAEHALPNAQSRTSQPRERLADLLTAADVHLATQIPGMAGLFVPSKVFGMLAAGRPALFIGDDDAETALVLNEERCGWVIRAGDADALVSLIERLAADRSMARDYGERARRALVERYSREDGCERWRRLLEGVVAAKRRA